MALCSRSFEIPNVPRSCVVRDNKFFRYVLQCNLCFLYDVSYRMQGEVGAACATAPLHGYYHYHLCLVSVTLNYFLITLSYSELLLGSAILGLCYFLRWLIVSLGGLKGGLMTWQGAILLSRDVARYTSLYSSH